MLLGQAWEKKFGYQVGFFNGSGQNNPQEDQKADVRRPRLDRPDRASTSFPSPPTTRSDKNILHFGIGYRGGEVMKGTATAGVFEGPDNETAANVEIAWRWSRLWAMGEYFIQTNEQIEPDGGTRRRFPGISRRSSA